MQLNVPTSQMFMITALTMKEKHDKNRNKCADTYGSEDDEAEGLSLNHQSNFSRTSTSITGFTGFP